MHWKSIVDFRLPMRLGTEYGSEVTFLEVLTFQVAPFDNQLVAVQHAPIGPSIFVESVAGFHRPHDHHECGVMRCRGQHLPGQDLQQNLLLFDRLGRSLRYLSLVDALRFQQRCERSPVASSTRSSVQLRYGGQCCNYVVR